MKISKAVQFLIDKKHLDIVVKDVIKEEESDRRIAIVEWLNDLDTSWELGGSLFQHAKTIENYIKKLDVTI
jgi:hypothetical protein